jgi:hypothetical protein
MADFDDGFDGYYANRLWQLLPGVYRAQDSVAPGVDGPLQELVNRIGAQIAVVRRSIDRLWADQSIETCDDWVIPYIGDLLDTNLLANLDAAGQRLDVAKTIHYRRRKGTVAILEEIARDVTGWDAHIVEAFRTLGRTRHSLDPPVGPDDGSGLLAHEGLAGPLTATPAGGFADLRSVHGAALAGSPFDEFAHTADLRAGRGAVGHHTIGKLLVFVWRLLALPVAGATPVAVSGCTNMYTFDPTGRQVPLFTQPLAPESDDFADTWTPALEWQVPGPLTASLQSSLATYPGAGAITPFASAQAGTPLEPVGIEIFPAVGQFQTDGAPAAGLIASYQYGCASTIGAGPYDRTLLGDPPQPFAPVTQVSGGTGLDAALSTAAGSGTVELTDSRTYTSIQAGAAASPILNLLVQAADLQRPVVRLAPAVAGAARATWTFTGASGVQLSEDGLPSLVIDGLLFSGGDIVLQGAFASVRLTGFTADPGTAAPAGASGFATSVDGVPLAPTTIWIEGNAAAGAGTPNAITALAADNCVLGPVRTRNGGSVESVTITDTIVQGLATPPPAGSALSSDDVYDPQLLAGVLGSAWPPAQQIFELLPATAQSAVHDGATGTPSASAVEAILAGLNGLIAGDSLLTVSAPALAGLAMDPELAEAIGPGAGADVAAVNRALLQAAFPVALAPAALAFEAGSVSLERVTVMGASFVHRLSASDSILSDFTVAQDGQDGCVRYSAVSAGSATPRQFSCAQIAPGSALFTSTAFGEPGYGQLLETVDSAIASAAPGVTISAGAENSSEMGAYCNCLAPVKENGLLVKYAEYMPLGLAPVIVHVT